MTPTRHPGSSSQGNVHMESSSIIDVLPSLDIFKPFSFLPLSSIISMTLQTLQRRVFGKHEKPNHGKSDIGRKFPPEILDLILRYLSVIDQICFSLACRSLYKHYISFLEPRGIQPSALFPVVKRRPQDYESLPPTRNSLLLYRLEDSRWRYCCDCLKLHRRSAWLPPSPSQQQSEEKLECMPYAGRIDLCFSLAITFSQLKYLLTCSKPGIPFKYECVFMIHPHVRRVPIVSTLGWNETGDQIILKNQYTLRLLLEKSSEKELFFEGIEIPLLTSHKNIKHWLQEFFEEGSSSHISQQNINSVVASLSHCGTKGGNTDERLRVLKITVQRNLGNGQSSDRNWQLNRVDIGLLKRQLLLQDHACFSYSTKSEAPP